MDIELIELDELDEAHYRTLYYHAFNRLTDLIQEIQTVQAELEEMYLQMLDNCSPPEGKTAP